MKILFSLLISIVTTYQPSIGLADETGDIHVLISKNSLGGHVVEGQLRVRRLGHPSARRGRLMIALDRVSALAQSRRKFSVVAVAVWLASR